MSRVVGLSLCCAMCLLARLGEAQDRARGPSAQEDATEGELPPGHPAIHGGASAKDPDAVRADATLDGGTVVVEAVDAEGQGIPGLRVQLEVVRESVAEGESQGSRVAATQADGRASFSALPSDTAHSFRICISHDSATFASAPFTLQLGSGTHVRLHVYPVTRDLDAARVASIARVYIRPQEEAFLVEAMFNIANFGAVAWVPLDMSFALPAEAEAFSAQDTADTVAIVGGNGSARLEGTVGPGVHSVVFSFQVPRHGASDEQMKLGMPPRLVQAEIMAESAPRMTLAVQGFPAATAERNDDGRRVLMTGARAAGSTEVLPKELTVTMGGVPVPGPGRWVALVLGLGFAVGGLLGRRRGGNLVAPRGLPPEDVEAARLLILDEVVALERTHNDEQIGSRTYEQARRELIDALARLEPRDRAS